MSVYYLILWLYYYHRNKINFYGGVNYANMGFRLRYRCSSLYFVSSIKIARLNKQIKEEGDSSGNISMDVIEYGCNESY